MRKINLNFRNAAAALGLFRRAAVAGPPYLTDDPQPTEPGHWEIHNFVQSTVGYGALHGEAGLDLNYGGAEDLQLTAVLPIGFDNENAFSASGLRTGTGMIELAAKYKFLHQSGGGWLPDVSEVVPENRTGGEAWDRGVLEALTRHVK